MSQLIVAAAQQAGAVLNPDFNARTQVGVGRIDAKFRVRGIEGLRVVDASAFPDQISGNPNAGIIMMAERAADMLLDKPQLQAVKID